jgi:hypothetical protein
MWRALFLAIGTTLIIVGLEFLAVQKITLTLREDPPPAASPFEQAPKVGPNRQIKPAGWAPWSLMSSGAVVCLYSFTLPRRIKGQ